VPKIDYALSTGRLLLSSLKVKVKVRSGMFL